MQVTTKKEVSCKILTPYFYALKKKGLKISQILNDIPYEETYLLRRSERIEWSVYCKLIYNMRSYFSPAEFEEVGVLQVTKGFYPEGVLAGFIFFSSNKISRMLTKQIFRIGKQMFSCVNTWTEYPDKNKIRVGTYLDQEYEFLPEFFLSTKGTWKQLGSLVGHKNFNIELNWITQGAIYDISWEKEGLIYKLKRGARWLFSIRKAFSDLTDSHQQLLDQYVMLEESKKLLQKQTTQLTTAYNITKSIKQSLDIQKTLNAITIALVNDAEFLTARVKLWKDLEGNILFIEAFSGTEVNVNPIIQSIEINNEKIGELIVTAKAVTDISDIKELINYLLPVINISIHDSLVLQEVTDYKNNLEIKVDDRTSELKKAQDELSKTILLLQQTQNAQNHFFTNISHEFRTPLTLILGPAKQIMEQTKNDKLREEARLIYRNAKKLNRLANQLLDLSRIEAGKMKLKASSQNLILVIKEIVSSFQTFAERKHISLNYNTDIEELLIYIDKFMFEKILSNILSNAIKFTPESGKVEVEVKASPKSSPKERTFKNELSHPGRGKEGVGDKSLTSARFVEIYIRDTGIGIPKDQIDKIFDRFYQVDNKLTREFEGTGVGLSLTKELIELHKGKIYVESEEGKGTIFKILLPLGKDHLHPDEITEEEVYHVDLENDAALSITESESLESNKDINKLVDLDKILDNNKPSLLIIEDNQDVRKYIIEIQSNHYKISEACDGEEGLNKSFDLIPDLIISDIMMPKIDGIKLCNILKTDTRTSHIPIILLTARATIQDKIIGLETGADDYIMKPFEEEELKARIKNLLEQRKRIHEHFQKYELFEIAKTKVTPTDQKFLQKAFDIITKNIADTSFGVEIFAENLAVSRQLLYKKLICLVGESPNDFIKRIRLNKARELIESNAGNISEIALEVGFGNPSYFAECFNKQFGCLPSQFHQKPTVS